MRSRFASLNAWARTPICCEICKDNPDKMIEPILHAVAADHVFDGAAVRESAAVIVDDARIVQVVPQVDVPRTIALQVLPEGAWLAPGFIDLQVNGGGD